MSNDTDNVRRFLKSHTLSLHEGISLAYELFNGNVNNGYELSYCVFDYMWVTSTHKSRWRHSTPRARTRAQSFQEVCCTGLNCRARSEQLSICGTGCALWCDVHVHR